MLRPAVRGSILESLYHQHDLAHDPVTWQVYCRTCPARTVGSYTSVEACLSQLALKRGEHEGP